MFAKPLIVCMVLKFRQVPALKSHYEGVTAVVKGNVRKFIKLHTLMHTHL